MLLLISTGDDSGSSLSTPFEQWCESMDLHPEDSRAWAMYEASVGSTSHAPAAS
jgi:hypothetical protein